MCSVFLLKFFLSLIFILVSVAFFTLLERSVLSYSNIRMGPNKIFYWGLFQPFSDALKLFSKVEFKMKEVNFFLFFISPCLGVLLAMVLWGFFPFWGCIFFTKMSLLLFILVSGLGVYSMLYSGWVTNTKYSLLGSYRSSAQGVSYEVVMIILFLFIIYWCCFLNLFFYSFSGFVGFIFLFFPMFLSWCLSCVAECNRSPFDFSEGESELVSGFNTEYGGGLFSLVFIAEYSSIIFFSFISAILFFPLHFFLMSIFLCFSFLWVRCSFPRLRYDLLMMMGWKSVLIFILGYFFIFLSF